MLPDLLVAFRFMTLAREFDAAISRLYRQGKIVGGAYPSEGNEASATGSAMALEAGDVVFPLQRDLAAHFVRGQSARTLMMQFLLRRDSPARGIDGTGHYADVGKGIYGNISHLGAMIPLAAGVALAAKLRGEPTVVMNYIGEGGAQTGEFHEGMNFAAVQKLPFVLLIENNGYAYSSPNSVEFACEKLSDRAIGYGCPGSTVDGTDVEAVYAVCREAVDRARRGEGPTLIETLTMRMRGHAEHDDASYVPRELFEEWKKKDPIARAERLLIRRKIATKKELGAIREAVRTEIHDATDFALAQPEADPNFALATMD